MPERAARMRAVRWCVRSLAVSTLVTVASVMATSSPAVALLAPNPEIQWRLGYTWGLTEGGHGADWGIGLRLPLQPSEIGIVSASASIQGSLTALPEWDFRLAGLVESYRTGRPAYGVFYTLRAFPQLGVRGSLTGIGARFGGLVAAYYPAMWNPDRMAPGSDVVVVEPGWFSGLYVQLRYAALPGESSVRIAVGLEERW